ncbi:MAG TPA: MOSC domain-containing protein [Blastocatellia bacterium]|nr:MOSC domain-containing protein [Blastocatellia bacterium]
MNIVSVNVGLPKQVVWKGKAVETGIFKEPVEGSVFVRKLNLDGDRQADLSVHGGPNKAVYAYPAEHYDFWRTEFPDMNLLWGMFGENLTVTGLKEDAIVIGDRFQIGSTVIEAKQPRMPCFKLGIKFGRDDIIRRFLDSGRTGFYFLVVEEGEMKAGDAIERIHRQKDGVTIADVARLYSRDRLNIDLLRRAIQTEALPEDWRDYFQKRLQKIT